MGLNYIYATIIYSSKFHIPLLALFHSSLHIISLMTNASQSDYYSIRSGPKCDFKWLFQMRFETTNVACVFAGK